MIPFKLEQMWEESFLKCVEVHPTITIILSEDVHLKEKVA